MKETIIKVSNLSKKYSLGKAVKGDLRSTISNLFSRKEKRVPDNNFWALKDISFEVKRGEVLGIIGGNGAGKSTLLKILSRITVPTTGSVEITGRVASLLEVGTGFHPELTGRENIFLNGSLLGMKKKEIISKFDEIIEFSGVEKFIDTPVKHYSSGMYVRLAFAVAAHLEPEILIVDEVLAVGDLAFQKKCLGKMGEVASGGKTVIFVSHNLDAIARLCNSVIVLKNGEISHAGATGKMIDLFLQNIFEKTKPLITDNQDDHQRKGDGAVRVQSVHLENREGAEIDTLFSGQWLKVVLKYNSPHALIKSLIVRLEIVDSYNRILFICNNLLSDGEFFQVNGSGEIHCIIDKLPLNKGEYYIHIFAQVNRKDSDIFMNAHKLNVERGAFYETGKLPLSNKGLLVAYNWSLA